MIKCGRSTTRLSSRTASFSGCCGSRRSACWSRRGGRGSGASCTDSCRVGSLQRTRNACNARTHASQVATQPRTHAPTHAVTRPRTHARTYPYTHAHKRAPTHPRTHARHCSYAPLLAPSFPGEAQTIGKLKSIRETLVARGESPQPCPPLSKGCCNRFAAGTSTSCGQRRAPRGDIGEAWGSERLSWQRCAWPTTLCSHRPPCPTGDS